MYRCSTLLLPLLLPLLPVLLLPPLLPLPLLPPPPLLRALPAVVYGLMRSTSSTKSSTADSITPRFEHSALPPPSHHRRRANCNVCGRQDAVLESGVWLVWQSWGCSQGRV